MGVFVSSLTENQIVAGFGTFGILLVFWIVGWGAEFAGGGLRGGAPVPVDHRSPRQLRQGLIDTKDLIYYVNGIVLALFLTLRSLESQAVEGIA